MRTRRLFSLAYLMSPASVPTRTSRASKIALFHAGGHEAEIEEVFRRILASGVPLDQVEIACASDAHVALIWEKALRHNWPVTLGSGIPATFTRPDRALIGLCDWIETDFSAGHLRRLLQSGDLAFEETEGFTAGQAARLLGRAEAGWGRATYRLALRTPSKELRISNPLIQMPRMKIGPKREGKGKGAPRRFSPGLRGCWRARQGQRSVLAKVSPLQTVGERCSEFFLSASRHPVAAHLIIVPRRLC